MLTPASLLTVKHGRHGRCLLLHLRWLPSMGGMVDVIPTSPLTAKHGWHGRCLLLHLHWLPSMANAYSFHTSPLTAKHCLNYSYTSAGCQDWQILTSTPLVTAKSGRCWLLHLCWLPNTADVYFYPSADCQDWQMPCLFLHLCWLPRLADTYFYTSVDCQAWQMLTSTPLLTAKHGWCLLLHLHWLPSLADA